MCEYCEQGKKIKAEYIGEGIQTMGFMLNSMFGNFSDDSSCCIAHINNNVMLVDNSSGEYAELGFKINYCPHCGAKMEVEDEEEV